MKSCINVMQQDWQTHQKVMRAIRTQVFIEEQQVPVALEWDGLDDDSTHVIAFWQQQAAGTARILNDGHIGRMAVLSLYRNKGIGSQMLTTLIDIAQQRQLNRVFLHAQMSAVKFYEKHHFSIISDQFMDANIPHVTMQLMLNQGLDNELENHSQCSVE